jgi:hypothetical protein
VKLKDWEVSREGISRQRHGNATGTVARKGVEEGLGERGIPRSSLFCWASGGSSHPVLPEVGGDCSGGAGDRELSEPPEWTTMRGSLTSAAQI